MDAVTEAPGYVHTQRAPLCLIVYGTAIARLVGAWRAHSERPIALVLVGSGLAMALLTAAFHLTIVDEGDRLAIRFGPLPLFRRTVRYADIVKVEIDRRSVYDRLPLERRQICWAHLKRDFQKCVDRGSAAAKVGRAGLRIVKEPFACWHRHRDGPTDRDALLEEIAPLARRLNRVLTAGRRCADGRAATFCANLLTLWPALWLFTPEEGVGPTNNHAERLPRRGVLWRKRSFGSPSEEGCRFVERMLTVVQTLRLQNRSAPTFLHDAISAHRAARPAPKFLVAG
jgi:transposase